MASRQRRSRTVAHHERMSVIDTAWLRMDGPGNSAMIVSVLTTATPVRAAALRKVLVSRLLCFPRFRRKAVADPFGASWCDDPDFDLDAHFVATTLPDPAGSEELQALAARLASERLDPSRPLWQVHFVERYGSGSAWVLRVHHCYADGMAMLRVMLSLAEQYPAPAMGGEAGASSAGATHARADREPGAPTLLSWLDQVARPATDILENVLAEGARLLEGGVHRAFHPADTATLAAEAGGMVGEFARVFALPDDPPSPLRGELSGQKRVAWAEPLDLAEVHTISRALGCTINDVLMATVAGALGSYLRTEREFDTRGVTLRASVPVNLRGAEDATTLGNRFGLMYVDLPVGLADPLERVFHMHDTMRALKGSLQPPMTLIALGVLGMLPAALQAPAVELLSRKATLVASNVPGPNGPLCLCGQRIAEMYFWVPQSGSIGVGVSILSYAGKVFLGVIADRSLLPEPASLAGRFGAEFERLLLAASVATLALRTARRRPARRRKAAIGGVRPKIGKIGTENGGHFSAPRSLRRHPSKQK